MEALAPYHFALRLVGAGSSHTFGPGDKGVDLKGEWCVSNLCRGKAPEIPRLLVIGQCKFEHSRSASKYLRELEGVISSLPSAVSDGEAIPLGLFVAHRGYTADALSFFMQMRNPAVLVSVKSNVLDDFGRTPPRLTHGDANTTPTHVLTDFRLNPVAHNLVPGLIVGRHYSHDRTAIELSFDPVRHWEWRQSVEQKNGK